MSSVSPSISVANYEPSKQAFYADVTSGLTGDEKSLPCKYFYDERGSQLFDQICELDEYYLTRTELGVMERHAPEMAAQIGPGVMLVEYGSGSSVKTRILLDHLQDPVAYVPVDISLDHLQHTARKLSVAYPHVEVLPVCADFTAEFELPVSRRRPTHSAVYFPGSTIGNFEPQEATRLLRRIAPLCGTGGGLLIGIDLQKDDSIVEAAYNDQRGVTAEFNRNLLHRINGELDADFAVDQFRHEAVYNQRLGRVEISLVSEADQSVEIGENVFSFADGEPILTEYSHKFTVTQFAQVASRAGLSLRRYWTDPDDLFAVLHLAVST